MKKSVLFVDDEPLILQGLERILRGLRNEWDMHFVANGEEALAFMATTPIDVVVTDMRMPGMNGAELLNLVMQRYPQTVRIILSGYSDQSLVLRCVGSTHQYLSKPCEAETLRTTVARAVQLEASLESNHLRTLIGRMDRLPSLPSIYVEIVRRMQDPDVTLEDIGASLSKDLGMTAKILKLANSAFFGLRREVSSPMEALTYLGVDTVKSLVLTVQAFSQFEGGQLKGFPFQRLWSHSLTVATAANLIARMEAGDAKLAQEAFAAGILHDLGKLVLAFNFPDAYSRVLKDYQERKLPLCDIERNVFEADHATVGGYLLGLWGLPVPVVEAIALHHEPAKSPTMSFCPLTAVYAANTLVNEADGTPAGTAETEAGLKYLAERGLESRVNDWKHALALEPAAETSPA
jgi:putative nucleotidyltransferase with HDIG domain